MKNEDEGGIDSNDGGASMREIGALSGNNSFGADDESEDGGDNFVGLEHENEAVKPKSGEVDEVCGGPACCAMSVCLLLCLTAASNVMDCSLSRKKSERPEA